MIGYNGIVNLRNDGVDPSTTKKDLNAAIGALITVRFATVPPGQGVAASLFDIDDVAIANPATSDNFGNYFFKIATGTYDMIFQEGTANEVIEPAQAIGQTAELINDLSQAYEFPTVAEYKASTITFPIGKVINTIEFSTGNGGGASYTIIASGTENGFNIIKNTTLSQSIDLTIKSDEYHVDQFGGGSGDITAAWQASIDLADSLNGGFVILPGGSYETTGVISKSKTIIRGAGRGDATKITINGVGNIGIRCAGHDTQAVADNINWGGYWDITFYYTFGSQVGISYVGTSHWATKRIVNVFNGFGATGFECKPTVLTGSGGPSQFHNQFEQCTNVGNASSLAVGAVGWDLGGTLATEEQITTWEIIGGRTNLCQIGVWLKGSNNINFRGHVTESCTDNWLIGTSGIGNRSATNNEIHAYIEGGTNGITFLLNSFRNRIVHPFITSLSGTAIDDSAGGISNNIIDHADNSVQSVLDWELKKLNVLNNPKISGPLPGLELEDAASNSIALINGTASSSANQRYRIHDGTQDLIRGGTVATELFASTLTGAHAGAAVSIFFLATVPPVGLGKDGDVTFSSTANGTMYQKRSGVWVSVV